MSRVPTITIGITAYNEAQNLPFLLSSILSQRAGNYRIARVCLVLDGCTDSSREVADTFASRMSYLTIANDGKHRGLANRLNELYRQVTTDIFVGMDADVVFATPDSLAELVRGLVRTNTALVGGNDIPAKPVTTVERAVIAYELFWKDVVSRLHTASSVHTLPGRLYAGTKSFIRSVRYPQAIYATDHFLFFSAVEKGKKVGYAPNAIVYYRAPNNMTEYIGQTTRFHDSAGIIRKHFGSWVNAYYDIPYTVKIRAYGRALIRSHVFLIVAVILQLWQRIAGKFAPLRADSGLFRRISSSKLPAIQN